MTVDPYNLDPRYSSSPITRWLVRFGGGIGLSSWLLYSGIRSVSIQSFTWRGRGGVEMTLTDTQAVSMGLAFVFYGLTLHLWTFWEVHIHHQKWAEPLRNLFALLGVGSMVCSLYRVFIDLFTKGV